MLEWDQTQILIHLESSVILSNNCRLSFYKLQTSQKPYLSLIIFSCTTKQHQYIYVAVFKHLVLFGKVNLFCNIYYTLIFVYISAYTAYCFWLQIYFFWFSYEIPSNIVLLISIKQIVCVQSYPCQTEIYWFNAKCFCERHDIVWFVYWMPRFYGFHVFSYLVLYNKNLGKL